MENFFTWMSKVLPQEDVIVWFNVNNMTLEKINLIGDIFRSLNQTILDTYLGSENNPETKINLTQEDKEIHFNWCWKQVVINFKKEKIEIKNVGDHKNYFKDFFMDTFYNQNEQNIKNNISNFIEDVFDLHKSFTKSDLDILTELYKLMDKNIQ